MKLTREELQQIIKEELEAVISEKWSDKYKRSIDCDNPKGFSQKAHCAGRKKNEEKNPRIPRKKGQPAKSKKHSDLYTDEDPKGTIHGLKFATVEDAKKSVTKIKKSGRSHAHKIQAAVAMEQRAKAAGKKSAAAVYRKYINSVKKDEELNERCQKGYKTHPTRKTKKMFGRTYRNCVKAEEGLELEEEKEFPEKVHKKARYIQDKEGKDRDQAYAIAISMYEDGDLDEAKAYHWDEPDWEYGGGYGDGKINENLILELTRRKFCQLMGMAGLAAGCGQDYYLLSMSAENEAGVPIPDCIQDPQIVPPLSDIDAWTSSPISLYYFMDQPALGSEYVQVEDDGSTLKVAFLNIPSTAKIWEAKVATENQENMFSEDNILRRYSGNDEVYHMLNVVVHFPIITGDDGEEYVKHPSVGGRVNSTPIKTGRCLQELEEWLGLYEQLDEIIDEEMRKAIEEKKKKRKKAGTESSKESSLRDWFGRRGAKGKKGGWVDCNAPDGKGGYKSCGRSSGEKRKKYPSCRPTPGACKERGKGKSWGKKAKKGKKG